MHSCVSTCDFATLDYMVCYQPRPNVNSFLCILFEVWSLNHYSSLFCKDFFSKKQIIMAKNVSFYRNSPLSLLVQFFWKVWVLGLIGVFRLIFHSNSNFTVCGLFHLYLSKLAFINQLYLLLNLWQLKWILSVQLSFGSTSKKIEAKECSNFQ